MGNFTHDRGSIKGMDSSIQSNLYEEMLGHWLELFPAIPSDILQSEFSSLFKKYSETHRHYHTLEHIRACLKALDTHKHQINDSYSLALALWFHDVIYNPKKNNNEELSAVYACTVLIKLGVSKDVVKKVNDLILLTIHPSRPSSNDEKILIDIDLGILGAEQALYQSYSEWIRLEYAHVPLFLYKRGRKKLLRAFLDLDYLYHSDYYREHFENQARSNIQNELAKL